MMEDILMDAIGELDDDLVQAHLEMRQKLAADPPKRFRKWENYLAVAACLVLVVSMTLILSSVFKNDPIVKDETDLPSSDGDGGNDNDGMVPPNDGDGDIEGDTDTDGDEEDVPPEDGVDGDGVTDGSNWEDMPYNPVLPEKMPKHFQFSLVWGTYGISSYDSQTGELVKTTDATHPEDYKTILHLSRDQLEEIYALIYRLNVANYPEKYNPFPDYGSDPSYTIILSVYDGVGVKTIECREIAIPDGVFTMDAKARAFIETYRAIRDVLTESEEWKALPEYENFYD